MSETISNLLPEPRCAIMLVSEPPRMRPGKILRRPLYDVAEKSEVGVTRAHATDDITVLISGGRAVSAEDRLPMLDSMRRGR